MHTLCDRCGNALDEQDASNGPPGEWEGACLCPGCFAQAQPPDDEGEVATRLREKLKECREALAQCKRRKGNLTDFAADEMRKLESELDDYREALAAAEARERKVVRLLQHKDDCITRDPAPALNAALEQARAEERERCIGYARQYLKSYVDATLDDAFSDGADWAALSIIESIRGADDD